MRIRLLQVVAIVSIAVTSGAVAGAAVAANGQPDLVRACAHQTTGALRLAEDCSSNEQRVTWPRTAISGVEIAYGFSPINTDVRKNVTARCPDGKVVIGGGAFGSLNEVNIFFSAPNHDGDAVFDMWSASAFRADDGRAWRLVANAICAYPG